MDSKNGSIWGSKPRTNLGSSENFQFTSGLVLNFPTQMEKKYIKKGH